MCVRRHFGSETKVDPQIQAAAPNRLCAAMATYFEKGLGMPDGKNVQQHVQEWLRALDVLAQSPFGTLGKAAVGHIKIIKALGVALQEYEKDTKIMHDRYYEEIGIGKEGEGSKGKSGAPDDEKDSRAKDQEDEPPQKKSKTEGEHKIEGEKAKKQCDLPPPQPKAMPPRKGKGFAGGSKAPPPPGWELQKSSRSSAGGEVAVASSSSSSSSSEEDEETARKVQEKEKKEAKAQPVPEKRNPETEKEEHPDQQGASVEEVEEEWAKWWEKEQREAEQRDKDELERYYREKREWKKKCNVGWRPDALRKVLAGLLLGGKGDRLAKHFHCNEVTKFWMPMEVVLEETSLDLSKEVCRGVLQEVVVRPYQYTFQYQVLIKGGMSDTEEVWQDPRNWRSIGLSGYAKDQFEYFFEDKVGSEITNETEGSGKGKGRGGKGREGAGKGPGKATFCSSGWAASTGGGEWNTEHVQGRGSGYGYGGKSNKSTKKYWSKSPY